MIIRHKRTFVKGNFYTLWVLQLSSKRNAGFARAFFDVDRQVIALELHVQGVGIAVGNSVIFKEEGSFIKPVTA